MGHARHPLSLALAVLAAGLFALLGSGCGASDETTESGSSSGGAASTSKPPAGAAARDCAAAVAGISRLRVTEVDCPTGQDVVFGWDEKGSCRAPAGASRVSCNVGGYRCLGAATESGLAVSCARPGHSVSFVAKRG